MSLVEHTEFNRIPHCGRRRSTALRWKKDNEVRCNLAMRGNTVTLCSTGDRSSPSPSEIGPNRPRASDCERASNQPAARDSFSPSTTPHEQSIMAAQLKQTFANKAALVSSAVSSPPFVPRADVFRPNQNEPVFVTFLTAGFPHPDLTVPLMLAMERGGADVIELGVPFTDPLADGKAIQDANNVSPASPSSFFLSPVCELGTHVSPLVFE